MKKKNNKKHSGAGKKAHSITAPPYSPLWKGLYKSIGEFIQAEPWLLFENLDVFIVQTPEDACMYLVSIMGNAGMEFGLNAFRGEQGMRNFHKMIEHEEGPPDRDLQYELDMLSLSLTDRAELEPRDLAVTKRLMLSFKGGRWPRLRSYRPHYVPWYLREPEIRALTHCLDQTAALCDEEGIASVRAGKEGVVLVRHFEKGVWRSDIVSLGYRSRDPVPDVPLDDITLKRLQDLPATGPQEELDLVNMPFPIMDNEPPYFALGLTSINGQGMAHQYGLYPPFEDYLSKGVRAVLDKFLDRMEKPRKVLLKAGSPFAEVFEPLCRSAEIPCGVLDELPTMPEYLEDLENSLDDRM